MRATESKEKPIAELPADTTPTWEMELLVSGATTFGLLQLPSLLDKAFFIASNRSPGEFVDFIFPVWLYSKVALITLIITFIVHLCLRGYWVALVGLDSVYPGGVRWQNLPMGPVSRAVIERDEPAMAQSIEQADNRATRVFGTGFGFAMVMLLPILLVVIGMAVGLLANLFLGPGHAALAFGIFLAMLLLPWAAAMTIDRRFGPRLAEGGAVVSALRSVLRFYQRIGLGRRNNKLLSLFTSHEGRVRTFVVALLVVLPVATFVAIPRSVSKGRISFGDYPALPAASVFNGDNAPSEFYADLGGDRFTADPLPYIQSRVVQGDYLELFIPYLPRAHAPALRSSCPAAASGSAAGTASREGLACLARLEDIRLDGAPVAVPLDASTDPQTGQRGVLAMIPVRTLVQGRHELSLLDAGEPEAGPHRRYRIPFWR